MQAPNKEHYRHYALAFDHYTHFTSPIRRYADLIVHRLLAAHLGLTKMKIVTSWKNIPFLQVCRRCPCR